MRIYISCDMEGVSGVTSWDHVNPNHAEYQRFRALMTAEANAAALGAFDAGADYVLLNDSHNDMSNIPIEELDPRIELLSGSPKINSMGAGLDDSFSAGFFIGYHHSCGGLQAVLDHTFTGKVHRVTVNGESLSEAGLFGGVAGYFGVPITLVTGDREGVDEAVSILGEMETVITKNGYSRTAALCRHPGRVQQEIREAAQRAAMMEKEPFVLDPPYELFVEFNTSHEADLAILCPASKRVDGYTVGYTCDDYLEMIRAFRTFCTLAGSS